MVANIETTASQHKEKETIECSAPNEASISYSSPESAGIIVEEEAETF